MCISVTAVLISNIYIRDLRRIRKSLSLDLAKQISSVVS